MRAPLLVGLLLAAVLILPLSVVAQGGAGAGVRVDSAKTAQAPKDSTAFHPATMATVPPPPKSRSDSVKVVKHAFNHRQQIITGSVVMACLAMIMVTMNNYNPR